MNILQQNFKILENKTQKEYDIETNFDERTKEYKYAKGKEIKIKDEDEEDK